MLPIDHIAPNPTPLYSKRAIRGFSMLFSAIAGGAMMAQNLRDVGQASAARMALWGSVGYTVLLLWLTSYLPDRLGGGTALPIIIGYAGALGLESYFSRFAPNRDDYPAKSIRKPLLICLAITIPFIILIIYLLQVEAGTTGNGQFTY